MRLFPDSWYVEIAEEELRITDFLLLAIKEAGFEGQVLSQSAGTGFRLKEVRVSNVGEIYVYYVIDSGRTAIEIAMDRGGREGFKRILRSFLKTYPKKPYGLLDRDMKRRWDEVAGAL